MIAQLDLFAIDDPLPRVALRNGLSREFADWLQDNEHVYRALESRLDALWQAGRSHASIRLEAERLRDETPVRDTDPVYKINGNWVPWCARLYICLHPHRAGFLELRGSK